MSNRVSSHRLQVVAHYKPFRPLQFGAEMVGTTRSRVSFFMSRLRKLGFTHYDLGLEVHSSLLNVVFHDSPDEGE